MQLETDRLLLRELTPDDWPAVWEYQRDPRYLRFYPGDDRSPEEARAFVDMLCGFQSEQPRTKFQLAIVRRADGLLLGNCGVRVRDAGARRGDIGYELDPRHWGAGYATEAARAMLDHGFATLKLHRIDATCVAENEASARVLARLGLRQEARLRDTDWIGGRWHDTLIWAIFEDEWRRGRQA